MLGIIGGTSWHSTVEYYRHINAAINALYGNPTNPPLVLYNLNQAGIHSLQEAGAWDRVADVYCAAALRLQAAGCQGLLLAANTAHKIFDDLAARIALPCLHIADAIGTASEGLGTVGLMGTLFTMEHDFLSRRLLEHHGVHTLDQKDVALPVLDTTLLHARLAVDFLLNA